MKSKVAIALATSVISMLAGCGSAVPSDDQIDGMAKRVEERERARIIQRAVGAKPDEESLNDEAETDVERDKDSGDN